MVVETIPSENLRKKWTHLLLQVINYSNFSFSHGILERKWNGTQMCSVNFCFLLY